MLLINNVNCLSYVPGHHFKGSRVKKLRTSPLIIYKVYPDSGHIIAKVFKLWKKTIISNYFDSTVRDFEWSSGILGYANAFMVITQDNHKKIRRIDSCYL
jgi:hypothetical protein